MLVYLRVPIFQTNRVIAFIICITGLSLNGLFLKAWSIKISRANTQTVSSTDNYHYRYFDSPHNKGYRDILNYD